jgi:hypothetical protein
MRRCLGSGIAALWLSAAVPVFAQDAAKVLLVGWLRMDSMATDGRCAVRRVNGSSSCDDGPQRGTTTGFGRLA